MDACACLFGEEKLDGCKDDTSVLGYTTLCLIIYKYRLYTASLLDER